MGLMEVGWEGVVHGRHQWRALVNAMMNLREIS